MSTIDDNRIYRRQTPGAIIQGENPDVLRDRFAGQAMQGIVSRTVLNTCDAIDHAANTAYKVADAMMIARGRR